MYTGINNLIRDLSKCVLKRLPAIQAYLLGVRLRVRLVAYSLHAYILLVN